MIKAGLLTLALMVWLVTAASATLIVDTGAPGNAGWFLGTFQFPGYPQTTWWLAGEFTTSQEYNVTSVQGWISGNGSILTVAILDNSGGLPGTTMFSQSIATSTTGAWQGPAGLNWDLPAGTYWAVFEAGSPMLIMGAAAPNPLADYALGVLPGPTWNENSGMGLCIQVGADAVPLPPTVILLGSGLLGLVGWRRFRKS